MKKLIWFLMFALIVQAGYKIAPALAQENKETLEIKKVVKNYLENLTQKDINSIMNKVSLNYSSEDDNGNIIDYNKLRPKLEDNTAKLLKIYADYSITGIETIKSDVKDNKATIWVVYSWKGFNLDTTKEESGKSKRLISLAKEGDSWKITSLKVIRKKLIKDDF